MHTERTEITTRPSMLRQLTLRILVVATVVLGVNYILWRALFSLNFAALWIAIPLVIAEAYSLVDISLFGMTMWRSRPRPAPPAAPDGLTVDVFVTTYNEPIEMVVATATAARDIRYPHQTWVLDDGNRDELRIAAERIGVGYLTRSEDWTGRPRHAKAGNLSSALMVTGGEFLLILDADQVPQPVILDRTLGYFDDPLIAFVQTPQVFGNVSTGDPLGSQVPLFYGPIQQGKDGWNAAFFCGTNAIVRREALMRFGVMGYVAQVEQAVAKALSGADRVLAAARKSAVASDPAVRHALAQISTDIAATRATIAAGEPIGDATYALQRRIDAVSRELVAHDLQLVTADLEALGGMQYEGGADSAALPDVDGNIDLLAARDLSPLGAIESLRVMLRSIDVDRSDEAQPLMPLATNSVTEDMATSMELHSMGWRSAYHQETLAIGLAPEDLGSALRQRLRWAQGTMQVMFRQNPLVQRGLTIPQRVMYFSTMWSYLGGFAAIVYFAGPFIYLVFGILPVSTTALEFFLRFVPFMIMNQLLFGFAGRGVSTWRGQQYSLALFPIWIRGTTSALANVLFHRPLDFVVTPKTRQAVNQWRFIRPQIVVGVILIIGLVIGATRLIMGMAEPIGTLVNIAWVLVDLAMLSVLVPAARYRGFEVRGQSN